MLFRKKQKKLSSQIENYFFGSQTIKFNYAVKTCISPTLFWLFRFLDIFFVHFKFLKKLSQGKT